jgi:hypothetical protein
MNAKTIARWLVHREDVIDNPDAEETARGVLVSAHALEDFEHVVLESNEEGAKVRADT